MSLTSTLTKYIRADIHNSYIIIFTYFNYVYMLL